MTMEDKKMSIKTSILWNTWGSLVYLGCQWLLSVLVIRISGFENSGILTLAMSITNMFYSIAVYGMRTFQVADTENEYSQGTYVLSRAATGLTAFILCTAFVVINRYDKISSLSIIIYMVFRLGEALFDVYAGFFQKYWRMDYLGKSMVIRGVVMLCSYLVFLGLFNSLPVAFGAMALSTFLVIIFYDRRNVKRITNIKSDGNLKKVQELLIRCFPLVVYLFLNAAISSIPRYFLEKFCGNDKLGVYAAIAAPTLVVQMASTYIFNPFVTAFAEKYHAGDRAGFWKLLFTCVKVVGAVSVAAMAGAALLGEWGLLILIGEKILPYTDLLLPLVACTILTAFSWLLCGVLTVVKDFRGLIISNVAAVVSGAVSSVVFIKLWGMQGTSFATILGLTVEIVLLFVFLQNRIGKSASLSRS
ncbi:MAG: hypothetical protein RHS_2190 [Robinsoniella sp. RHS]|nr:MAG: hypothetical protein RHS_2190 [Robinsoniella sp. RHS]